MKNESNIILQGRFENTSGDTTVGVGNAGFHLLKDWTNDGVFIAGQSTVFLDGANQAVRGTTVTPFHHLTLNGTGIKSLAQSATVSGTLSLNDRELATGTNTLTVKNTSANAISRTTGFVSSLDGGLLERTMDDSVGYSFPLGSSAGTLRYRPLVITPSALTAAVIGARLANTDATLEGYDRSSRSEDICGINALFYHQIERTQGSAPVSISMFYKPVEDGLWSQIAHWQNVPQWELAGLSTEIIDTQYSSLTIHGWNDFSEPAFGLMVPATLLDSTQTVLTHVSCNSLNDGSVCVSFPPLTGTPPFHYTWSNGDTTDCISSLTAGIYELSVTDSFNCPNVYSFEILQPNPIDITVDEADVSCKDFSDGSICLTVSGDSPPFAYQWNVPGTQNCITALAAATYSVTVTDDTGCVKSLIIPVNEPDLLEASVSGTDISCYGFGNGYAVALVTGGVEPYNYQWDNAQSNDSISGLTPDSYNVTITDDNGCTVAAGVNINQPDSLIVAAGHDTTVFTGFPANLYVANVSGGLGSVTYVWTPSSGVANPSSSATTATPNEDTGFVITVTDENGCVAADTLHVQVDVHLYTFPDAFAPNGDGVNDTYMPVTSSTVQVLKLDIFNRWGQLVASNPFGWDGKFDGKLQPMDTYVYQSVLLLPDGTQKKEQGDFILIW